VLDPKLIRNDLQFVASQIQRRGMTLDVARLELLEKQRRDLQENVQSLQNQRNQHAKKVGQAKANGGDVDVLLLEVKELGDELVAAENKFNLVQAELNDLLALIPNIPHESVPDGKNEADNKVIRTWGDIKKFDFVPKDHVDLGAKLGMDFDIATKLTGSRFVVLRGQMAKLQRALARFMLDLHIEQHGYQEISVPYIVNSNSLFGTGQLPKMREDLFAIQSENDYYLIPTSEVCLANLVADSIVESNQLPLRFVSHSHCFRSEAGSYGRDTRGMIRQHQFEKVELVQIVAPEDSYAAHEEITSHAEKVLQRLELPYRVVSLCTGDLGFTSAKTYDLEVWLPSQQCYREISSCSNTEAFQARRMKARFRNSVSSKPELVHTLNGSALAVGRTLVAILENHQDESGRINIPESLRSYMGCNSI